VHNPECYLGREAGSNVPAAAPRSGSLREFRIFPRPYLAPPRVPGKRACRLDPRILGKRLFISTRWGLQGPGRGGSVLQPDGQCRMVRQAGGSSAGWSGEHVLPGLVEVTRFLDCDGRAGHDVVDADTALAVPGMVTPLA
jgi:hypothetical protein